MRSYFGEQATDNGISIQKELQRRGSDLPVYWAVQDVPSRSPRAGSRSWSTAPRVRPGLHGQVLHRQHVPAGVPPEGRGTGPRADLPARLPVQADGSPPLGSYQFSREIRGLRPAGPRLGLPRLPGRATRRRSQRLQLLGEVPRDHTRATTSSSPTRWTRSGAVPASPSASRRLDGRPHADLPRLLAAHDSHGHGELLRLRRPTALGDDCDPGAGGHAFNARSSARVGRLPSASAVVPEVSDLYLAADARPWSNLVAASTPGVTGKPRPTCRPPALQGYPGLAFDFEPTAPGPLAGHHAEVAAAAAAPRRGRAGPRCGVRRLPEGPRPRRRPGRARLRRRGSSCRGRRASPGPLRLRRGDGRPADGLRPDPYASSGRTTDRTVAEVRSMTAAAGERFGLAIRNRTHGC